jgi:hypothetical protein
VVAADQSVTPRASMGVEQLGEAGVGSEPCDEAAQGQPVHDRRPRGSVAMLSSAYLLRSPTHLPSLALAFRLPVLLSLIVLILNACPATLEL